MDPGSANAASREAFNVRAVRSDFPILDERVRGKPLVYLDNAATTQKPRAVLDAIASYYETSNANVHRGVHTLSERATEAFEGAREKVRRFVNAGDVREVIFTRGTTEAINLVAQSWGRANVREGDEIVVTEMEHHSNIVPWQMLAEEKGAKVRVVPIDDHGDLRMDALDEVIGRRTRIVALTHVSNALGTVNDVAEITRRAQEHEAVVLVDGAQAAPHVPVDVRAIGADFYALSGHKMYGPTGIGVLYGRAEMLEKMAPWQGGGDMIKSVTFERTVYNDLPYKFEAGTPDIAGAVGLGAALDYLTGLGVENVARHEDDVLDYATEALSAIDGVRLVGTAKRKVAVASFVLDDVHPHDVGTLLDREGIAIRTGHHCAQPVMQRFGVPATCRASLGVYNSREDVDALVKGIHKVKELFS